MQITVLIENEGHEGLRGEHGLSLYVRCDGGHVALLDAGRSGAVVQNAQRLGCPLEAVDAVVLSHGHYDHGNGFSALFRSGPDMKVYARPAALEPQFGGNGRYIGLSEEVRGQRSRFILSDECRAIAPGVWLVPDAVEHEQSLVVETERGLVVLNSCCHAGADTIVAGVLARFPGKSVRALVGGLHLMGPGGAATLGKTPGDVRDLARRLTEDLGVEGIYTGHCTGKPGYALLEEAAPGKVFPIHTGDALEF